MKPEVVHERFAQYLKDRDLDGLGSLFDEDAMFVPGPGQEPVYGRAGIKEALKSCLASPSTMEVGARSVHQRLYRLSRCGRRLLCGVGDTVMPRA